MLYDAMMIDTLIIGRFFSFRTYVPIFYWLPLPLSASERDNIITLIGRLKGLNGIMQQKYLNIFCISLMFKTYYIFQLSCCGVGVGSRTYGIGLLALHPGSWSWYLKYQGRFNFCYPQFPGKMELDINTCLIWLLWKLNMLINVKDLAVISDK